MYIYSTKTYAEGLGHASCRYKSRHQSEPQWPRFVYPVPVVFHWSTRLFFFLYWNTCTCLYLCTCIFINHTYRYVYIYMYTSSSIYTTPVPVYWSTPSLFFTYTFVFFLFINMHIHRKAVLYCSCFFLASMPLFDSFFKKQSNLHESIAVELAQKYKFYSRPWRCL